MAKMKTDLATCLTIVHLNGADYLLTEVQKEAKSFRIEHWNWADALFMTLPDNDPPYDQEFYEELPKDIQYTIVGKGDQINEEQWKGIVPSINAGGIEGRGYYCYCGESASYYETATPSGHSWIISHGMKPETTLILKQLK